MTNESENPNTKPPIFIGSSREGLKVARLFQEGLRHESQATLWCQPGIFEPSDFTLESLETALDKFRYAVIILTPDDLTRSRGRDEVTPRDNAVFEMGLFAGRHGRRSVFFAIPDSIHLRLPSDVIGLTPLQYNLSTIEGMPEADVSVACSQILRAVRRLEAKRPQPIEDPLSAFWDVLADTIFIIYGVEQEPGPESHPRHRVSLRDLETAWELNNFLARRYPAKRVSLVPASSIGWQRLLQSGGDLIVVGGFVTNGEFAKHRSSYEQMFRLKMGRLCLIEGQAVFHPEFLAPVGFVLPPKGDPNGVNDFPTEFATRDFGYVFHGSLHVYGRIRRVIAIAGVKGNGTRGAALYLTGRRNGIDSVLSTPLSATDTLEVAVSSAILNDVVDKVEPIRIVLNSKTIHQSAFNFGTPCELGRPCQGCDFGVPSNLTGSLLMPKPRWTTGPTMKAIIFDLDDTLIDTFETLIIPLEVGAAKAMIMAGAPENDPVKLAAVLLRLRRSAPEDIEDELQRTKEGFNTRVLSARRKALSRVSHESLTLSPEVAELLLDLRQNFALYLLTSGPIPFQNQKIEHLGLRRYFVDVVVTDQSSRDGKKIAIADFLVRSELRRETVLVVGNRLDQEIAAAKMLGMPTVWIRRGEGSELRPAPKLGAPDVTIASILQIRSILKPQGPIVVGSVQ